MDTGDNLLEQLWANYGQTNAFMRPTKASMIRWFSPSVNLDGVPVAKSFILVNYH